MEREVENEGRGLMLLKFILFSVIAYFLIRFVRGLVAKGKAGQVAGLDTNQIIKENFISTNVELADHFLLRFMHRIPKGNLRPTLMSFLTAGTRAPSVLRLPAAEKDDKIRGLIRLILVSPEYQLC